MTPELVTLKTRMRNRSSQTDRKDLSRLSDAPRSVYRRTYAMSLSQRRALSSSEKLNSHEWLALAWDHDDFVTLNIAARECPWRGDNPWVENVIPTNKHMIHHHRLHVRVAAIENQLLDRSIVSHVMLYTGLPEHRALATSTSLKPEHVIALSRHSDSLVRAHLAANHAVTAEILLALAADEAFEVRESVWHNAVPGDAALDLLRAEFA